MLDVGCGQKPLGDVNCDLYVRDALNHRNLNGDSLNVHEIPNFVVCDGSYLPFASGSFDVVYSYGVIEHLEQPQKFFQELARVSCQKITVITSHRLCEVFIRNPSRKWLKKHHVSKMSMRWLKQCAAALGLTVTNSYVLNWVCFPHEYMPLFRFPCDIGVECAKQ